MPKLKNEFNQPQGKAMRTYETAQWFDPDTWPEGFTEDQFIKKTVDDCKSMIAELNKHYSDNAKFQKLYQFRYVKDNQFKAPTDQTFKVVDNNMLTFNLARSVVNTAHNKIAKLTPKVTLLTKDANSKEIETAKTLDKWLFKLFKKTGVFKEASMSFLEACVGGVGAVKVYLDKIDKKGIYYKKISSSDFFFNKPYSGGNLPDKAGERHLFTYYELMTMFPKKAYELQIKHGDDKAIMVYEIYKDHKMYAICSDKMLFARQEWKWENPYELIKWTEATDGVLGVALVREVFYIQQTITYLLDRILRSIHRIAVPRVLMAKGSDPTPLDMDNLVAGIIQYNALEPGSEPKFITPPVIHQQVFNFLYSLWEKGFEVTGLSTTQAFGKLPKGLEQASGVALRAFTQIESERFQLVRKDYEQLFVRLAKKTIEYAKDGHLPKGVNYSDIKDAMDNLSIFASNILPETPAGRFAFVSDLLNSRMITTEQALALMDSPDIDKLLSSESSRMQAIEKELETAVKTGKKPDSAPAAILGVEMYLDQARKMYAEILIEEGSGSKKIKPLALIIKELQAKLNAQLAAQQLADQGNAGNKEGPKPQPLSAGPHSEAQVGS